MGRGHRLTDPHAPNPRADLPTGMHLLTESNSKNGVPHGVFPLATTQPPQATVKNTAHVKLSHSPGSKLLRMEKVAHQHAWCPSTSHQHLPGDLIQQQTCLNRFTSSQVSASEKAFQIIFPLLKRSVPCGQLHSKGVRRNLPGLGPSKSQFRDS